MVQKTHDNINNNYNNNNKNKNNNNNNININNNNKNNSKNKEKCPRMTIEKGNSNLLIEYVYYIKKKKMLYLYEKCMRDGWVRHMRRTTITMMKIKNID